MDEQEYLELIDFVKQELEDHGFSDVTDDSNFLIQDLDVDTSTLRLMEPKQHLIALLDALDTKLMLLDGSIVKASLKKINKICEDQGPLSAVVLSPNRGDSFSVSSLSELRDMSHIRRELQELIFQIDEN